ncbi:polysaccharide biosynthesis protein [Arcticibacter tournemirensis]|uniref:Polysaccharide biosynthesis protein n=1 Tax=Arcticibacter tournemirensis TaxID=699437 RepID=A0A5M9HN34_9SPHI|nr:UDP-N-acetylglucosamine 4,6-dehydratase family protein [Arcticibacter tournemirensis]KAA8486804.1 polysaccharide biosynthesis protein [Arcticibacter tournemirensis]TQM49349.1 polysaccharide biosynthesis protein [Arcticibacter tournemirensis]
MKRLVRWLPPEIGSEIARQVLNYDPEMVILCDQAESPLHEIQLEVEENFTKEQIRVFIADINNFNRMYYMFNHYRPEIIFHAAAYKHVPMMEMNPMEAVMTNVMGTKNIADLAVLFDAKKFVMVSTDKAVNPTNVMGATKRIAEVYIQSLNNYEEKVLELVNPEQKFYKKKTLNDNKTRFVTTRFGNVLGSSGSVIPRFRNQIQQGKAVTVTHPDITRYFMTIPEAVELVLEAGSVGEGGEIFVFDMGEPVKIIDLARNMIKLAGMEPDIDIPILVTGLRPGEKLYEELLNEDEKTCPTHHKKIKIAKVASHPYTKITEDIAILGQITQNNNELDVVKKMKEIVPEFISKNSRFEDLDQSYESVKEEVTH